MPTPSHAYGLRHRMTGPAGDEGLVGEEPEAGVVAHQAHAEHLDLPRFGRVTLQQGVVDDVMEAPEVLVGGAAGEARPAVDGRVAGDGRLVQDAGDLMRLLVDADA